MLVFCFLRVGLSENRAFGVDGFCRGLVFEKDSLPRKTRLELRSPLLLLEQNSESEMWVALPCRAPKQQFSVPFFAFYDLTKFISIKRLAINPCSCEFSLFLSLFEFWQFFHLSFSYTGVVFLVFLPLLLLLISGNCVLFKPGNAALQI